MRIVIVGGSGLIGSALAAELWGAGHDVVVTSRSPEAASHLPAGVTARAWDAESATALTPIVDGADAVVHLVGESLAARRWTAARKRRLRESRLRSTAAVAAAIDAAAARPAVLLQGSAVGYYGSRGDEILTEASGPGTGFLAELCRAWEAASAPVEALGVRRVLLRTGVVLAPHGGALPRLILPFRLFAGGPLGDGRQWVSWIHLADEVAAMRFLLAEAGAAGVFNLAAPDPRTNRDFGRALGEALSRPSFLPTPAVALRLALGEMAAVVLDSQRVLPERLLAAGYTFRYPRLEAALADCLA